MKVKCELYNDNFQNRKKYNIPRAQLVIADIKKEKVVIPSRLILENP